LLAREIVGTAKLGAARESFAARGIRWVVAVLEREGGA
jgi:putative peptide zinc metalloprotease protein